MRLLLLLLFITLAGCNTPIPFVPQGLDASEAAGKVACELSYHQHLCDHSPDTPDNPMEGCENCYDTGWMGDGRPRSPCPLCNDPLKKPQPSVQDYLRQIDEWKRKTSSGPLYWSPTEEEWNSLQLEVGDIDKGLGELEEKVANIVVRSELDDAGDEDLEEESLGEPSPPIETPSEPDRPVIDGVAVLTMHSFKGCLPCETWWKEKAPLFGPSDKGEYRVGILKGMRIEVRRDNNHGGESVPWWTLEYNGKTIHSYKSGVSFTPGMIWERVEKYVKSQG